MMKGSKLREEASIMGRRMVTESAVDEFEPGRRFTFQHVSVPIPVSGEYVVEGAGDTGAPGGLTVAA